MSNLWSSRQTGQRTADLAAHCNGTFVFFAMLAFLRPDKDLINSDLLVIGQAGIKFGVAIFAGMAAAFSTMVGQRGLSPSAPSQR